MNTEPMTASLDGLTGDQQQRLAGWAEASGVPLVWDICEGGGTVTGPADDLACLMRAVGVPTAAEVAAVERLADDGLRATGCSASEWDAAYYAAQVLFPGAPERAHAAMADFATANDWRAE